MTSPDELQATIAIFEELPVGITAIASSGKTVFSNHAGFVHATLAEGEDSIEIDGRAVRIERVPLTVGTESYQICLSYDITEQRQLEDDLFRRAYFDILTGLPNRGFLEKITGTLLESPDSFFALAFIDLDGFKNVNDYYGHAVGDGLLVKIAERLSSELRPSDMLARVGGDEFILLLSPASSIEQVEGDVQRFLARLKEPFFIDGYEILTSASIGVCLYPNDGDTFDALCEHADQAMYRIKDGTKGRVHFYDQGVGGAASERMKIEQRLRLAVRDRRICCAYQPKVDFRSGKLVGIEVLLRWRDEHGLIQPPGDFVNLAVELGLMDEITHLVLAETLDTMDLINEAFGLEASISINVAARQADEPVFMRSFIDAIAATGYAERFMLEVTEEAFLSKSRFQTEVLPMIRECGARVSIDDFGTGYSSLSALADITADEIKVDRSFITDIDKRPRSQSILKAIESLAQALDMSIIVEGVETMEELLYLQGATRIRLAQGFYFSKPMFLDDVTQAQLVAQDTRPTSEPVRISAPRAANSRGG